MHKKIASFPVPIFRVLRHGTLSTHAANIILMACDAISMTSMIKYGDDIDSVECQLIV